jgi:hypothetical protein
VHKTVTLTILNLGQRVQVALRGGAVVRSLVVLSLFVAGCLSRTEADSCTEKVYSGGVLRDCGDIVEFEPSEPRPRAYVMSNRARPLGFRAAGVIVGCTDTDVPEGRWIICPDGLSRLERHDATAREAAESGGTLAELGEHLPGVCEHFTNAVRARKTNERERNHETNPFHLLHLVSQISLPFGVRWHVFVQRFPSLHLVSQISLPFGVR